MDSSIKQFVSVVIAVLVGTLMITFVNSSSFQGSIEEAIGEQLESITTSE